MTQTERNLYWLSKRYWDLQYALDSVTFDELDAVADIKARREAVVGEYWDLAGNEPASEDPTRRHPPPPTTWPPPVEY